MRTPASYSRLPSASVQNYIAFQYLVDGPLSHQKPTCLSDTCFNRQTLPTREGDILLFSLRHEKLQLGIEYQNTEVHLAESNKN